MQTLISERLCSQSKSEWLTPGGIYDRVYDGFGNKYLLKNIRLDSDIPFDTAHASANLSLSSAIGYTCNQGYFNLYFQNNMVINGISTPSIISQAQAVVCEVFRNISDFILTSSLTSVGAPKINIYVSSTTLNSLIAAASPLYALPINPINPNQGFLDNQMQKMLLTSNDPYSNIPLIFDHQFPQTLNFFHGYLKLNSTYIGYPINFGFSFPNSGEFDFYTTVLHEIGHCLGIASLISIQGPSVLSGNNNSYTRYDSKLFNSSGNSLLGTASSSLCGSQLTFTVPVNTSIASSSVGCITNSTNCNNAVKYLGTSVTLSVYTPNCFEPASSLAHFEDMCSAPYNPTNCTPIPSSPGYNNLYFVMSNASELGMCGFKRYFKEEEYKVLCDMGYTLSTTYSSTAAFLTPNTSQIINYTSTCNSSVVVGQNDGINNGVYVYTTTTNSISIPTSSLLLNDFPSTGLSISCVEIVYTNSITQHAAAISGSNIVVSGVAGSGLAVVKYTPVNSSGLMGNATYVFVYFLSNNCNPANYCNLIQNNGFENSSGLSCGQIGGFPSINAQLNCWEEYPLGNTTPSLYVRTCTTGTTFNLGLNTLGTGTSVINSFNGVPNDKIVGLTYTNSIGASAIKNNLSGPIIPGQQYNLSFWAINYLGTSSGPNTNVNGNPIVVTVACHTLFPFIPSGPFPQGLHTIAQFTIPAGSNWQKYSMVISTPTTQINLGALIIGVDAALTDQVAVGGWTQGQTAFCFLDEISLMPQIYPLFTLGTPTICGNVGYGDLSQYCTGASSINFSGPSVNINNGLYSFNLNSYLSPGTYPIQASISNGVCDYTSHALVTVSTNTDFASLSNTVVCSNASSLNLNNLLYLTPAVTGGTLYVNGTPTNNILNLSAPSNYTISFDPSGTGLCSMNTVTSTVQSFSLATSSGLLINGSQPNIITANTHTTCGVQTLSLTFNPDISPSNLILEPGNFTANVIVTPSINTTYTITVFSNTLCPFVSTLAVEIVTNCCNGVSLTPFTGTATPSSTVYNGSLLISNDVVIPSYQIVSFASCDIQFLNNAKITIQGSSELQITGSHLHSCDNNLWSGIVLNDGASLLTNSNGGGVSTLIEDATTAIDVSNYTNTAVSDILDIQNTIFNKNYISINISNYTVVPSPYAPFSIKNCVFTCRDLPFTPSSWPQTGTVNATSTSSADLRYVDVANTPTTGLAPPFLNQSTFTITNLKNPYNNHRSQIAIQINSVGVNSGTVMYGCNIGSGTNASDFNLFDAHVQFIVANNSNLTCINNVFQNTQSYTYTTNATNFIPGKAAVEHNTSGVMNTKLYMSATSKDLGNRFWNCHIGVFGNDIYTFNIENATFRSTQSTASLTSTFFTPVGGTGIGLNTNRFEYYIAYNEFTNINNSINIPISVGTFTSGYFGSSTLTGIFAGDLRIYANTFDTGTLTTNYSNNAVTITAPHNTPYDYSTTYTPYVPPSFSIPYNRAIVVTNNTLTGVFRGIYLNGITGFQTEIMNNSITMRTDATFSISQYGIKLTNASPTSSTSVGKNIISANTVSISSATSQTNILGSLIYCGNNGYGICSPSVTCNNLTRGYQGFVFDNANKGTIWASNTMSTPIARGLVLDNAGEIGVQGSNAFASANQWVGAWSASLSLYGTFTGSNSIAANSALWVKNNSGTVVTVPPANYGYTVLPQNWYDLSNPGTLYTSNGGDHTCSQNANNRNWSIPNEEDFVSSDQNYMSKFALYRFLHFNDSLRNAEMDLDDFYSENSSTSIGMFMQVEENLYDGNLNTASGILGEITTSNQIENNYSQYYNLYLSYADNDFQHTNSTDSTDLAQFALLCPGENGACVYQARALYNSVYNSIINDSECESSGARMASNIQETKMNKTWAVKIYPNPASGEISLLSTYQNDRLKISVYDLLGRLIIFETTEVKENLAKLTFDLENGVYLITIINKDDQTLTEKLIISK